MNTIHIFAYGEAQIIGKELNYKTNVSKFTKLQAVIDDVKSKKPADVQDKDYHAINIFNNSKVVYLAKEKEGTFSVAFTDIDSAKLNALIQEFADLKAAEPVAA
jgi:hypothetical protein